MAQTPTPDRPASRWSGTVSGRIVTNTPGATVPGNVSMMLHAWDENLTQKLMRHAQAGPDGSFRFEEVPFEPGVNYAVMAIYRGVTYFSDPAEVGDQQDRLELEVPVYETTTDASPVRIDRLHIAFAFAPGGLSVTELYSLSNPGDRTMTGTVTLESGQAATLAFPLPENAANVGFGQNAGGRFVQFAGGFADTAPLLPGTGSGQVVVSYVLPYSAGMAFSYQAPYPIDGVNFLLPADSDLALSGEGLVSAGTRELGQGATFAVMIHDGLDVAETLEVVLSGAPPAASVGQVTSPAAGAVATSPKAGIVIGGSVLGLVLIGIGLWWLRQPAVEKSAPASAVGFDDAVREIARLDEAHDQGQISDEDYHTRRATLRGQARLLFPQDENGV